MSALLHNLAKVMNHCGHVREEDEGNHDPIATVIDVTLAFVIVISVVLLSQTVCFFFVLEDPPGTGPVSKPRLLRDRAFKWYTLQAAHNIVSLGAPTMHISLRLTFSVTAGKCVPVDEAENPCNLLGDAPLWDRR